MIITKIKLAVKVSTHKSTFFKLNESTAWKLSSACVTDEIFCVAVKKKKVSRRQKESEMPVSKST